MKKDINLIILLVATVFVTALKFMFLDELYSFTGYFFDAIPLAIGNCLPFFIVALIIVAIYYGMKKKFTWRQVFKVYIYIWAIFFILMTLGEFADKYGWLNN